jgi:hypothetical protein
MCLSITFGTSTLERGDNELNQDVIEDAMLIIFSFHSAPESFSGSGPGATSYPQTDPGQG